MAGNRRSNRRNKERKSETKACIVGIRLRDAETFWNILFYHGQNNLSLRNEYMKKLSSDHAERCAGDVLNCETLVQALSPLLPIKGLWSAVFIFKVMHKVVWFKCHEVRTKIIRSE